jgi:hypothetical protein
LGTVELVGDEPPVPGEDAVRFGHASHLVQSFASESLADLSQRASLRIRRPQPCWQARPENSILRGQVLVLKEEFLVDQPCYIRQQTSPMIAVFHAKFHHRSFLIFKLFEYFDHSGTPRQ